MENLHFLRYTHTDRHTHLRLLYNKDKIEIFELKEIRLKYKDSFKNIQTTKSSHRASITQKRKHCLLCCLHIIHVFFFLSFLYYIKFNDVCVCFYDKLKLTRSF